MLFKEESISGHFSSMSTRSSAMGLSGSINTALFLVNLSGEGIKLASKSKVLFSGGVNEVLELDDGFIVVDGGSLFGFIQSAHFVPKVRLQLVDKVDNFNKIRLISVLLCHFDERFENSGLFLHGFDLGKLVGGIDHVLHKRFILLSNLKESTGAFLFLFKSVEAFNSSSAAFDSLDNSSPISFVSSKLGLPS